MRLIIIGFIALFFSTAQALAGVVFEIETKDFRSNEHGVISISVDNANLKMAITSAEKLNDNDMIFHGDQREMVVVEHEEKRFMVIDEAMISSFGERLSGIEAQMREALKNIPPERRAMMEQMMKGKMPPQVEAPARQQVKFRNTGEHETKNGYPCVKYELTMGARKTQELWITDWNNVDGGEDAARAFTEMAAFFKKMRDSMPSFARGDDDGANPFEHMSEMNGFPVLTHEFSSDGSVSAESSLRSSTRRTMDSAEFEPPASYKRHEMMPQ